MFPLKLPIPHFQTLGALRDTFQCTHDPPQKKRIEKELIDVLVRLIMSYIFFGLLYIPIKVS